MEELANNWTMVARIKEKKRKGKQIFKLREKLTTTKVKVKEERNTVHETERKNNLCSFEDYIFTTSV